MERRARGRRSFAYRLVTLLGIALVAILVLAACGDSSSPYSTITPRTPEADDIQFLYKVLFYMALVVFVGVQVAIVYTVLRFRRKTDDVRPEPIHGNKTLEIVWTIIPAVVLLVIFIPTVRTLYDRADEAEAGGDITIEVYGKQWWWEIHYTDPTNVANVITANEVHVPAGKKILFQFYSNNVIHSFWVPQLSGKMDVIPGHINELTITPSEPGVYFGECAEFCGDEHAWMRFRVIVEPEDQFNAWIAAWNAGPTQASGAISGDVAKAPADFGLCLACHRINGTNASVAPVGLDESQPTDDQLGTDQTAGPNLTLFGCRSTIGAGILANTPENLAKWLHDPGAVKPGNYMSTQVQPGTLTDDKINTLVAYLESLTPEGGCQPITGQNADLVTQPNVGTGQPATPEASPAATPAGSPVASPIPESPTAEASPGASPPATTGGQTAEIGMYDINFNPNVITVPADTPVPITITNHGATMHNFSITDHKNPNVTNLNISENINPGETKTVTVNAPAGTYYFYCDVPGHEAAGMFGYLEVKAGAAISTAEETVTPPAGS
jgi:cytochrome c oxidase subunit 2